MNTLPLVDHSYASGTQSAVWHEQHSVNRSFNRISNEAEDHSSAPEHETFLHTLRNHFEPSKDSRPAVATSAASKQDAKSSADQPQPDKAEDLNSAPEYEKRSQLPGRHFEQNRDAVSAGKPEQTKEPNSDTTSVLKQDAEKSADQVRPDAKIAPQTAQLSERTLKSKPAEDTVATSKAHEPKETDAPEQASDSLNPVAQLLDNAAALIFDIAPNTAATPTPSKPNDNTPSRSATIDAAAVVEAPELSLPAAGPILGDLAFALRIKADSSSTTEQPAPNGVLLPRESGSLLSNSPSPALSAPSQQEKLNSQIEGIIASIAPNDHGSPAPQNPTATDATTSTHTSDFEAELSKFRAAEPVRGAHVQISGVDAQRIDIRLVERGGALSVTVRSADDTLAKNLQEHASELNTRLNLEHYRTELWTPSAKTSSNTRDSGAGDQQNGSGSYSGSNQDQRQNNKQRQSQPDWIDALEQTSKAFQKRIEYTWQQ